MRLSRSGDWACGCSGCCSPWAPLLGLTLAGIVPARAEEALRELRIDWATYNPLSLWIEQNGLLEKEFAAEGTTVRWVQSLGSNKALEFLNAGAIDIGSSAGAAALLARVGGNPVKAVGVFSQPEWTALVTRDKAIGDVAISRAGGSRSPAAPTPRSF